MRILVTGARAPVALHIAGLMHDAGCHVDMADTFHVPLVAGSPFVEKQIIHPSPVFEPEAFRIWAAGLPDVYDMVLPTCEETFHLSACLKSDILFAPEHDMARQLHSKAQSMAFLDSLGIDHPRSLHVPAGANHIDWPLPGPASVVKREFSRFGSSTRIGPDTLTLSPETSWVLQERLDGTEICVTALMNAGRVCGFVAYEIPWTAGQHSAGIYYDPAPTRDRRGDALLQITETIGEATEYTGILSFDTILCDGRPHVIEINPRATSGIHFFRDGPRVLKALQGDGCCFPVPRPQMLGAAMRMYYPLRSILPGRLKRDMLRAQEATNFNGTTPGGLKQMRTALALAWRARRRGHRASLLSASTYDIEWNE